MSKKPQTWKSKGTVIMVECPACKQISKTNVTTLTYAFDVRKKKYRIKGIPKWKTEVERHYGTHHPRHEPEEAKKIISNLKYGEDND